LSGASTATAAETLYVIGDLNTNCTFNGVISDGAAADTAIIKSGNAMLTLTGNNTFTGDITVNSGTLRANNTAGSATGVINNLEIFSGATLTGNGIIGSATTVDNGAIFAPGDPSGTLTISNSLTLNDSSLLQFGLGTVSDSVKVSGNLFLTGQLSITNAGGFGPGSYPLFTCGGALTFDNLVLVSAPAGYNYSFDTNTTGVVKLVATLPVVNSSSVVNGKMIFAGTGGSNNATFYVVASTNLAAPINNWISILTNQFDASGNFAVTNISPATNAQYFYRLKLQ
jgi:fibronectin-binding autotransporter adhesin